MSIITVYGVRIRPEKPYLRWMNNPGASSGAEHAENFARAHEYRDYLLPSFIPPTQHIGADPTETREQILAVSSQEEADSIVRERFQELFFIDLNARHPQAVNLPESPDWEDFNQWINWQTYRTRADKKTGKILEWTADEKRFDRFDFYDDLKDESGNFDEAGARDWRLSFYEKYALSPEYRALRGSYPGEELGYSELFVDIILSRRKKAIHALQISDLEYILLEYLPRESLRKSVNAQALIHELYALFKYFQRVFHYEQADEFLARLSQPNIVDKVRTALEDRSLFSETKAFFLDYQEKAKAAAQQVQEPQVPYIDETASPGRNDPCSCGSGRKYKKCCMRKG